MCLKDIKEDILSIIEMSEEITLESCERQPLLTRIAQRFIQPFTPLM